MRLQMHLVLCGLLENLSPLSPHSSKHTQGLLCQLFFPPTFSEIAPGFMSASLMFRHNCTAVIILCNLQSSTNHCCSALMRSPPTPWCDCFHTFTIVFGLLCPQTLFSAHPEKWKWHFKISQTSARQCLEQETQKAHYLHTCIIAAVRRDYCVFART